MIWRWPRSWWNVYFFVTFLAVPAAIGVISTVWFMIGGSHDIMRLFRDLARQSVDAADNGQVLSSGQSEPPAAEPPAAEPPAKE